MKIIIAVIKPFKLEEVRKTDRNRCSRINGFRN